MLTQSDDPEGVVELPQPKRNRPKKLDQVKKSTTSEKEAYSIDEFMLTGPQWVRLLSLLCSMISDDEYSDLEVAKTASLRIDEHLQSAPKFKEEIENLRKFGGEEVEMLIKKLTLPPWER